MRVAYLSCCLSVNFPRFFFTSSQDQLKQFQPTFIQNVENTVIHFKTPPELLKQFQPKLKNCQVLYNYIHVFISDITGTPAFLFNSWRRHHNIMTSQTLQTYYLVVRINRNSRLLSQRIRIQNQRWRKQILRDVWDVYCPNICPPQTHGQWHPWYVYFPSFVYLFLKNIPMNLMSS